LLGEEFKEHGVIDTALQGHINGMMLSGSLAAFVQRASAWKEPKKGFLVSIGLNLIIFINV